MGEQEEGRRRRGGMGTIGGKLGEVLAENGGEGCGVLGVILVRKLFCDKVYPDNKVSFKRMKLIWILIYL